MRLLLISMLALAACRADKGSLGDDSSTVGTGSTDADGDGDLADEDVRTGWYTDADADEAPGAAPRRTAST